MRRHELRVYSEFSESDLMVFWLVGFSGHWACQVLAVEQCMDGSGAFVHLRAVQRGLGPPFRNPWRLALLSWFCLHSL